MYPLCLPCFTCKLSSRELVTRTGFTHTTTGRGRLRRRVLDRRDFRLTFYWPSLQYLVKWIRYTQLSCELHDNIKDAEKLTKEFNQRYPDKQGQDSTHSSSNPEDGRGLLSLRSRGTAWGDLPVSKNGMVSRHGGRLYERQEGRIQRKPNESYSYRIFYIKGCDHS